MISINIYFSYTDREKYDLVKMLFIRGAQPDIFEMARTGRTAVVNILLDLQPSRLTEKDSRGCTILDYAYENNHDDTAIALVAKGATADTWQLSREGKTVILSAALNKAYYRLDEKVVFILPIIFFISQLIGKFRIKLYNPKFPNCIGRERLYSIVLCLCYQTLGYGSYVD